MRDTLFPIALIVVGAGWLVSELHLLPEANWIVIFGLIAAGLGVLAVEGINRSSIVTGPLLIAGGVLTFVHERTGAGWSVLIPVLLMLWGLLLLVARLPAIPERSRAKRGPLPGRWADDDRNDA
ncbi:hypothetical protein IGB42_01244 [Andreprevotia sp. IGB-42]|uniref:hypothetical protein n=1 Tax=Andreprevotia sp. IGB-42 TaxID=2497473 RepID=UPI00135C3193|nr:hypothetical protein [Andreprevotia sp. IGB-42]KAF0814343.1 hypothetical protein IGB42_01244 [Andreprevotia sp. IGB-42]